MRSVLPSLGNLPIPSLEPRWPSENVRLELSTLSWGWERNESSGLQRLPGFEKSRSCRKEPAETFCAPFYLMAFAEPRAELDKKLISKAEDGNLWGEKIYNQSF